MMVDDFEQFARTAQPGTRMAYGRGDAPPRDAVLAMRDLVEARVLVPVAKREAGSTLFMVERGLADLSAAKRPARGRVRRKVVRKSSFSMVFDLLARTARRGLPCPTNDEIAERCHLSGKLAASYRMRRLVAAKQIAVEDHSPFGRRVVTILTGPHAGLQTVAGGI